MISSDSFDVLVIGAGVLGLCAAAELTARGRRVCVVDPGGQNASSVAAGMIAPAFESATEQSDAERAALLRRARDLWPAFAAAHGLTLDRSPAEWRGADAPEMAERLLAYGFDAKLDPSGGSLLTHDDWRVEVGDSLNTLRRGVAQVEAQALALEPEGAGWRLRTAVGALSGQAAVIATGAAPPLGGLSDVARDVIGQVRPVRGQIGLTRARLTAGVVRGHGAYIAPAGEGSLIGATMEPGERETTPSLPAAASLLQAASRLVPEPEDLQVEWRVGVRGATTDGLPLAGEIEPHLLVALAPRRNGWLLGPAVARTVAEALEGRRDPAFAAAFDPLRFSPPAG